MALRGAVLPGIALAWLVSGCAPAVTQPVAPIQIVLPSRPLDVRVAIREGSFARSHLSPRGVLGAFADEMGSARVFAEVLNPAPPGSAGGWELELAASDYGEEDAYSLELQAVLLRARELVATYFTKQSRRQRAGTGQELLVGPGQLAELGQQAIRDLVRQLAADAERLRRDEGVAAP